MSAQWKEQAPGQGGPEPLPSIKDLRYVQQASDRILDRLDQGAPTGELAGQVGRLLLVFAVQALARLGPIALDWGVTWATEKLNHKT